MSEWISVKKRLPECDETLGSLGVQVLIWPPWKEDGVSEVRCSFFGRRYSDDPWFYMYGRTIEIVDYWMPLPEGPMEVGGTTQ